ncbi:MAG: hypothetical protein QM535_19550 [Limnohabitans sp.]|nr:hypothetical protein [Limnohabitans sp.]
MNTSKKMTWTLITIAFLTILYSTNPKEYQLKMHIQNTLKEEAINKGGIEGAFQEIFSGPQSWLMGLTTEKKDLYIFSLYTVDGFNQQHKYLGIMGNFIELPAFEETN